MAFELIFFYKEIRKREPSLFKGTQVSTLLTCTQLQVQLQAMNHFPLNFDITVGAVISSKQE